MPDDQKITPPQQADTAFCSVCGEPLELIMTEKSKTVCDAFGIFKDVQIGEKYPAECRCRSDERKAEKAKRETEERIDRLRKTGIADSQIAEMRFESDLGYNREVLEKAKRYVESFEKMREKNIGIIFTGEVGTGKTFYAGCIANALIDRGILAVVTSLSRIIRTPFDEYEGVLRMIERAGLVVFDDLGAERDTSFAWERAFDAVDARIKAKKPIIVTTNLTPDQLGKAEDIRERRIYDRILGACIIIPVTGQSIRILEQKSKLDMAREFLAGGKA